jgi:polyvinyl alcohol dehydrogenase (cytochrome)
VLRQLSAERIGFALAYGIMSQQGRDLSRGEIGEIVRFLAGTPAAPAPALPDSTCRDPGPQLTDAAAVERLGCRYPAASLSIQGRAASCRR